MAQPTGNKVTMATKPNCRQCGYKTKSLYQPVGVKAAYTRLDKWYYCQRDNWVMNSSNPEVMSDFIKALNPKYRQVNVSSLDEHEIKKMLMDPFI
ncbi:MAG: hypothetical protein IH840_07765 [Candidatus Heimdallarchaeota archaeon]|nr:hypothetical protein [Candidatus Heimdallarchaeota archaeon]